MSFLSAAWEQRVRTPVADGQIANWHGGRICAYGAVSALAGNLGTESLRSSAGPLPFVLLMTLLLVNLYSIDRRANTNRASD